MNKTTTITVRIDDATKQRLLLASDAQVCHISDLIRLGIDHVLSSSN